jgi:hypothetical protein
LRMCATLLARGSNSRPVGYIGFGHVAIMSLMSGQALIQPRRSGNTKAPCVAQPSTAASRVITTASTSTTPGSRTLPSIAAAQKPRRAAKRQPTPPAVIKRPAAKGLQPPNAAKRERRTRATPSNAQNRCGLEFPSMAELQAKLVQTDKKIFNWLDKFIDKMALLPSGATLPQWIEMYTEFSGGGTVEIVMRALVNKLNKKQAANITLKIASVADWDPACRSVLMRLCQRLSYQQAPTCIKCCWS